MAKKKMRHTPGPLEVLAPRIPGAGGAQFLVTQEGKVVARVALRREVGGDARADAELFASAPDLLSVALAVRAAERMSRNPVKSQADAWAAFEKAATLAEAALQKLGVLQ